MLYMRGIVISMFVDMLPLKKAKVRKERKNVEEREMITLLYFTQALLDLEVKSLGPIGVSVAPRSAWH